MTDDCFQLKGSVITTFILEFNDFDAIVFAQQLKTKVDASPGFFQNSTVIIDFSKIDLIALPLHLLAVTATGKRAVKREAYGLFHSR